MVTELQLFNSYIFIDQWPLAFTFPTAGLSNTMLFEWPEAESCQASMKTWAQSLFCQFLLDS